MTIPIVDAHHHIWRLAATPWLQGPVVPRIFGAYDALRRDYSIADFTADAAPHGVQKSVFVQVNVAPGDEVDEAAWVNSVVDVKGFPHAITAFADLSSPSVADTLDREMVFGRVCGVRQQIHWHEKELYRFASRPDVMNDAAWRRGLAEVGRRGLLFELQVFPGQMRDAERLVADFPEVQFVLLHAGMIEDRSDAGWAEWRRGMTALAARPNLSVKLSGLGTFRRSCDEADWRPVIERTIDMFGPSRCLFGSNFPIESLWTGYGELLRVFRACLSAYGEEEQRAVLHDTASRLYRLTDGPAVVQQELSEEA
jgi:predicted TIM-barrel fold metal-dependent hydrolase